MGSDWLLRFRSERDLDRLETVSYRVVSAVDNDFVKTTVSRDIFNPANVSQGRDFLSIFFYQNVFRIQLGDQIAADSLHL